MLTVGCVKMVKKNFQVTEGTIDLLRALTTRYGKKADGLMITAGLLRLKSLSHDELARAVADAFTFRANPESNIEPVAELPPIVRDGIGNGVGDVNKPAEPEPANRKRGK